MTVELPDNKKKPALRWHLFSLRVKFILVFTLLVFLVMCVLTGLILYQVRQTLIEQILNRAEAQASSLAINSVDEVINQIGQATTLVGASSEKM